jgi:hypothetical protein
MNKDYIYQISLISLIAILHGVFGIMLGLYMLWWFDILMHFLGGLWVGISAYFFIYKRGFPGSHYLQSVNKIIVVLAVTLIVGLIWEVFEYANGLTFVLGDESYYLDTCYDIIMDLLGGMTALYLYGHKN